MGLPNNRSTKDSAELLRNWLISLTSKKSGKSTCDLLSPGCLSNCTFASFVSFISFVSFAFFAVLAILLILLPRSILLLGAAMSPVAYSYESEHQLLRT
ncbi:MAG TPA: hypothetical protein DEA62_03385 [Coxiellaceae bacterium]|nr:hypothetical protein [Coxiellaceae bacterium]